MYEWTNWSGRQRCLASAALTVRSEADMIAALRLARAERRTIRAVGASHSHSRAAATDGIVLDFDAWMGVHHTDPQNRTAVIRAGSRIFQLGEPLHSAGLALRNQGDIDKQSLAGAIATGTHGTGPTLQNLSASVTALHFVRGGRA